MKKFLKNFKNFIGKTYYRIFIFLMLNTLAFIEEFYWYAFFIVFSKGCWYFSLYTDSSFVFVCI